MDEIKWEKGSDWNELGSIVGKIIKKLYLSKSKTELYFECENDEIIKWECMADCCSDGWIEHISVPYFLGDSSHKKFVKIMGVFTVDLGEVTPTKQECDLLYGIKLKTAHEDIFIEFRNSSNGYYGSWMQNIKNPQFNKDDCTEITESF